MVVFLQIDERTNADFFISGRIKKQEQPEYRTYEGISFTDDDISEVLVSD